MEKRNYLTEIKFWIKVISFLIVLGVAYREISKLYTDYKESTKLVEAVAIIEKVVTQDNKTYVYLRYKVEAVYYDDIKVEVNGNYESGEEVTIYYDPFNPFDTDRINFEGKKIENLILIAVTALLVLLVGWMVVRHILKVKAHNNLADNGIVIKALVLETSKEEDNSLMAKMMKQHYKYGFRCEAEYLGEKYYFYRRDLREDTSKLKDQYVNVYVDPNNEKYYYIIPQQVGDEDYGYNDEDIKKMISISTLSNDFDDFMNEIEKP